MRIARIVLMAAVLAPVRVRGQTPVTRSDAISAAQQRGARGRVARGDSLVAEANRRIARALPNPTFSAVHSAAVPTTHLTLDIPIDAPWARGPRIGAAAASLEAARARYVYERAAIRFEAESVYTGAVTAQARARLSHRTAIDAESLLTLARLRRDAGDASELDVATAEVNAGRLANAAADDSIQAINAILDVQRVMGLRADSIAIAIADSLAPPADPVAAGVPAGGFGIHPTLPVLAATSDVAAARAGLRFEHRSVLEAPSFQLGIETGDPSDPGVLPLFGVALPIPLFNRRGGNIALASAGLVRAEAILDLARRTSDADIARAMRERTAALDRVRRDGRLLASAERVLQLAILAYREGAAALPNVLEAARAAREALVQYIDDVATALTADATLRWLTTTWETP